MSEPTTTDDEVLARLYAGGAFVLDAPAGVPAVWGHGDDVLWPQGEALLIVGPPGVGKTTLVGTLVRGLIVGDDALGLPVTRAAGRVLYLAMDRPRQIARSLRRQFTAAERPALDERLVVWSGPPPVDLAQHPAALLHLARLAGASHVIVDSLKDAAVGLTDDAVGAGWNRARQALTAAGIEIVELHHQRKGGANGTPPTSLADVYGSVWITSGVGSVLLLWGQPGDPVVRLSHLKQAAGAFGPVQIVHDQHAGTMSVLGDTDPLQVLRTRGEVTPTELAVAISGLPDPKRNDIEKARRKLDGWTRRDLAERVETPAMNGGPPRIAYRWKEGL